MARVTYETPEQENGTKTIQCDDFHTEKESLLTCVIFDDDNRYIPVERVIEVKG